MEDLQQDSLVMIQHKFYLSFFFTFAFILPSVIPSVLWMESIKNGFLISVLRYVALLQATWLVNSAAHIFGMKPYDKTIGPVENMSVTLVALGEGFLAVLKTHFHLVCHALIR